MRKPVILVIISLIFSIYSIAIAGNTETPPQALTISQAIDYALSHNRDVKIQEAAYRISQAQIANTKSNWLFQLDWSAQYNQMDNGNNKGGQANTVLEADKPILSFGKSKFDIQRTQIQSDRELIALKKTQQDIAYQVTVAFFNVLYQNELVKVNEAAVLSAKEHLESAELRLKQGVNTKFDVTRSKVDLANRQMDLISAQNAAEKARQSFNQLLFVNPSDNIKLVGDLTYQEYRPLMDELWALTLKHRPQILDKQQAIEQNTAWLNYQKAVYYPTLSLGGKYTLEYTDYSGADGKESDQWSAYLKFTSPLLDGGKRKSQIQVAKVTLEQAQYDLEQEKLAAKTELEQTILDLTKREEMVKTSKATIELAELSLSMAQLSYENGKGTTLDVTDAELSLRTARINQAKAINDYLASLAQLKKVTGSDLPGEEKLFQ